RLRRGQDDDGDTLKGWIRLDDTQRFPAIHAGHVQVEQDDAHRCPFRRAREAALAAKAVDQLLAVLDEHQGVLEAIFLERLLDHLPVVWVIVGHHDRDRPGMSAHAVLLWDIEPRAWQAEASSPLRPARSRSNDAVAGNSALAPGGISPLAPPAGR